MFTVSSFRKLSSPLVILWFAVPLGNSSALSFLTLVHYIFVLKIHILSIWGKVGGLCCMILSLSQNCGSYCGSSWSSRMRRRVCGTSKAISLPVSSLCSLPSVKVEFILRNCCRNRSSQRKIPGLVSF